MPRPNYYGLILAGGRGTRFWPRSRKRHAKQVLSVTGDRTLIQQTVDRLRPLIAPERIWVLTNDHVRDEIVRQLPEVPARQIIAEPAQRNTAPAIGLMATILESTDPNSVFGVFPSDHVIGSPRRYLKFVRAAFQAACGDQIAVLGVYPGHPETGFGYIEFPAGVKPGSTAALPVLNFQEKPQLPDAERMVKAGNFYWNAGMFFSRPGVMLHAIRTHLPKTATLLAGLPKFGSPRFRAALAKAFPLCDNISIDYGIMQKTQSRSGIACSDYGWSDVGSWSAVYDLLPHDKDRNAHRSEVLHIDATGNYVDCGSKLVALVGVHDLVVVDTPDALLIVDRQRAQDVGAIVKLLEKQQHDHLL
jgi:mannose-1-phosphate guanylyltransferase